MAAPLERKASPHELSSCQTAGLGDLAEWLKNGTLKGPGMRHPGGQNICGAAIGVLCLESYFPKPPGHIKNPSALPFTLLYETIPGITVPKLLDHPSAEMIEPFILAAQRLEREGVRAITGSCGFLALFQKELSEAVSIPVFSSSLIQIPMIYHMTGAKSPVGVLTAKASALTPAHLAGVGADHVPIEVMGLEDTTEFRNVILENKRTDMDLSLVEAEVVNAALSLKAKAPDIRSMVLECTDLPPYAAEIQNAVRLPVFDIITLSEMAYRATARTPYTGAMPW
ncbi:MAG: aspartate/glutamate racemase family protein [Pseudomonadota bacterium]